jgi:manganese efflux pump family protein
MSVFAVAIVALSMSIDAFVAALSRGAALRGPRLLEAVRTGLVFGVIEGITPIIGWTAGLAASRFIESVDHWIAFVLLAIVGGHMIFNAVRKSPSQDREVQTGSWFILLVTAFGTSIDAMIVGVSLAFLDVNIFIIAAAIGAATFALSTLGILAGRTVGTGFGRWAEAFGGIGLIGLGSSILIQHLSAS